MLSIAAQTVIISTISRFDLRTTISAAPRHRADEAFLLQHRQRLADRRAAHAEVLRKLAFVEPDLERVAVDVHLGDRALDRLAGLRAQADAERDGFGGCFLQSSFPRWHASWCRFWYATTKHRLGIRRKPQGQGFASGVKPGQSP